MRFVIVTPGYDDNAGGIVVLHQLCDRLNRLGHEAFLWSIFRPRWNWSHPLRSIYLFGRYFRKQVKYGFKKNPKLNTPAASVEALDGAVIVYPEVVVGNPLQGKNIVRWLLHRPGYNNGGKIGFGEDDLFFFYDKVFDDARFNKHSDNLLHIVSSRSDVYMDRKDPAREGACYLLRKGYKRPLEHDASATVCVDGLSHEETAVIFNRTQYCYSYDAYTMYNVYAAMCGCVPVIIPEKGVSKAQWQPDETKRYGLAYGFDDIDYAIQTRDRLLETLRKQEEESDRSVTQFVEKCRAYYAL